MGTVIWPPIDAYKDELGDLVKPTKIIGAADEFFMDAHEVTVGQFKKFLKSSGYKPDEAINWNQVYKYSPTDKHPISRVTWHNAAAYANRQANDCQPRRNRNLPLVVV